MKKSELKKIIKKSIQELNEDNNNKKIYFCEIKDSQTKKINRILNKLNNELVPQEGPADTVEGEMIRAIIRILYRYFNDGDYFFKGYGKETCGSSVKWLITKSPLASKLKPIFRKAKVTVSVYDRYTQKDLYQTFLYDAAEQIIKYVLSKKGKYTPSEGQSSR